MTNERTNMADRQTAWKHNTVADIVEWQKADKEQKLNDTDYHETAITAFKESLVLQ